MLFDNPTAWSLLVVGTWPRFFITGTIFLAMPFLLVDLAIHGGWPSAIGTALFIGGFQLMFLYALRRATVTKSPNSVA